MRIAGLVGRISTGKSVFTRIFQERGWRIIELDLVARGFDFPGSEVNRAIANVFGDQVLQKDGTLERRLLRGLVFQRDDSLERLNGLTFPFIRQRVSDLLSAAQIDGVRDLLLVGPILYQLGLDQSCVAIFEIRSPEELIIQRLLRRDRIGETEARDILKRQDRLFPPQGHRVVFINDFENLSLFQVAATRWVEEWSRSNPGV